MLLPSVDYAVEAPPAPGTLSEVVPGILWTRMPLPFALDHVNLWLLADADGWCAIDAGIATDPVRELWDGILAGPLRQRGLRRLLVTHMHPDHVGLAGWLVGRSGAEFLMPRTEYLAAHAARAEITQPVVDAQLGFYRRAGVPEAVIQAGLRNLGRFRAVVSALPAEYRRICHGDEIGIGGRTWRVIIGEGHAPEMACLYSRELNVLIAADQVLPRISPNVSVWPSEPFADPLSEFLASMERFRDLPRDVLVLPSHGLPFRGLHARMDELVAHHAERLEETLAACRNPCTVMDLVEILFRRPLDAHQMAFAIGEAAAHLNHLERQGRLLRSAGADEVWHFTLG
jgi:glyoxylase-like metal-dependent hydrolase (beta-lactamase superfamily II)